MFTFGCQGFDPWPYLTNQKLGTENHECCVSDVEAMLRGRLQHRFHEAWDLRQR